MLVAGMGWVGGMPTAVLRLPVQVAHTPLPVGRWLQRQRVALGAQAAQVEAAGWPRARAWEQPDLGSGPCHQLCDFEQVT